MHKSFQQFLIRIAIISMQGKTLEKGRNTENPTIEKKKKIMLSKRRRLHKYHGDEDL